MCRDGGVWDSIMDSGTSALWRFVGCAVKICWGGGCVGGGLSAVLAYLLVALSIQIEERIENVLPRGSGANRLGGMRTRIPITPWP